MWYVIWSLTGREEKLIAGIRAKVPVELYRDVWTPYKVWIKKSGGVKEKMLSRIFPGYIFIDTDDPDAVNEIIKHEKECHGMLGTEEGIIPLSEEERRVVGFFTGSRGVAGVSLCLVEQGRLRVIEGPIKGMEDKIIRYERGKNRVWVRLDNFLGEDRELSFAVEIVERN